MHLSRIESDIWTYRHNQRLQQTQFTALLNTGVTIYKRTLKKFSWIPIVGSTVPDQAQSMRIRLKVAVVDVKTGRWEMFSPKSLDERSYSARINRAQSDQAQVAELKKQAYVLAAETVLAKYVK